MKNLLFILASLTLLFGCEGYGGGVYVESGLSHTHRSPPAHAPAHGLRRGLHRYHYYPNAEFYFDISRNMYFYLNSRGAWTFSVNLPIHLHQHLSHGYVEIEMESDRPYTKHKHHKAKYKKHKKFNQDKKYKKKNKGKQFRQYEDEEDERHHKKGRKYHP